MCVYVCVGACVSISLWRPRLCLPYQADVAEVCIFASVWDRSDLPGLCGHTNLIFLNQILVTFISGLKSYMHAICGYVSWMKTDRSGFVWLFGYTHALSTVIISQQCFVDLCYLLRYATSAT